MTRAPISPPVAMAQYNYARADVVGWSEWHPFNAPDKSDADLQEDWKSACSSAPTWAHQDG
ncbi:hypothetical protein MWU76_16895 [Gelidibacter sp. F2691]|nr:hypothetical protein [Gelidibacter sp. F2691]